MTGHRPPLDSGEDGPSTRPSDAARLDRIRERGQLLLVGAVAISLIILGLVVVYNTVLFTETQDPSQSLESSSDVSVLRTELVNSTRELVGAVHNDTGLDCASSSSPPSNTTFTGDIRENATLLGNGLTNSTAKTGVSYVTLANASAECDAGEVWVNYTLVARSPESDYRTSINRTYEDDP